MNFKYIIGVLIFVGVGFWFYTNATACIGCDDIGNDLETTEHYDEDDQVEEYEIYPGDVADKIENGEDVILLDVRTLEEHVELHLKNSYLLPVEELSQKSLDEIGLGQVVKDREIIVYCRSGNRSKTAYDIMTSLGYTNVKSSAGGMIHWEEDEYPYTEAGEYVQPVLKKIEMSDIVSPKISLNISEYDLGEITQYGGVVEIPVIVSNDGIGDLIVGDITTSCSCTSSTIEENIIAEGKSSILTVIFDPDFHEEPLGVFKRTVFIPSNDVENPEVMFTISVDILEGE